MAYFPQANAKRYGSMYCPAILAGNGSPGDEFLQYGKETVTVRVFVHAKWREQGSLDTNRYW